jgi:RNA 2',3'-cyclic 3'-phosphodiesterase
MSVFVAVSPPEEAVRDLAVALDTVRPAAGDDLRWTAPETWHLTLAFLGQLPEDARAALGPRLVRAAGRHGPLELALVGAGYFGSHVLFARVGGDLTALRRLAASVAAAARRVGATVDDRAYRPHLTVARSRGRASLRPLAQPLAEYAGPTWTVEEFRLMESRSAGVAGRPPAYHVLGRFTLGGEPAEHA